MIKANLDERVVHLADFAFSDSQKYESTETVACVEALVEARNFNCIVFS